MIRTVVRFFCGNRKRVRICLGAVLAGIAAVLAGGTRAGDSATRRSGERAPGDRAALWRNGPGEPARRPVISDRNPGFDWGRIESDDYESYIRNLRAAGCPEKTIRRLVSAEIHEEFDERRKALLDEDPIPFWEAEFGVGESRLPDFADLAAEEQQVITGLLVPAAVADNSAPGMPGGFRFGNLPAAKRSEFVRITETAESERDRVLSAAEGRELPPAVIKELAAITAERDAALEQLLTAEEREDFEVRNSALADELRESLRSRGLHLTEARFREWFRARKALESEVARTATEGGDLQAAWSEYLAVAALMTTDEAP